MKDRFRVVLLGSLGVAVECIEWLLSQTHFEVLGAVCTRKPVSRWRRLTGDTDMQDVAPGLGVPLLELDDLCRLRPDFALAVRYHALLRKRHLESVRLGVVNFHGAPLPQMRGSMCDAMAIIENRTQFGASLHWMDEGIDTGDILVVRSFPISRKDTVYDLFQRSNRLGLELIKEHLLDIATGKITSQRQDAVCQRAGIVATTYRRKDVLQLKAVRGTLNPEEIWNRARAFDFPGHEPAYVETPHGRVHLAMSDLGENGPGKGAWLWKRVA